MSKEGRKHNSIRKRGINPVAFPTEIMYVLYLVDGINPSVGNNCDRSLLLQLRSVSQRKRTVVNVVEIMMSKQIVV
jgi:hypothetical protein